MTNRTSLSADIGSGTALSNAVCVLGYDIVAIQMPAAWTSAVVTFETSMDDSTYSEVYDDAGNEVSLTVAAGRWVTIPSDVSLHFGTYIKVRSGTNATPVNQAADRELGVIAAS